MPVTDQNYLDVFMQPLRVCRAYKPKFGNSEDDTSERLLRLVIKDALSLSDEDVCWSFEVPKDDGTTGTLKLDARIPLASIQNPEAQRRVREWLTACTTHLSLSRKSTETLDGAVFEIRQGYKSADSKRQNADLRFAARALGTNFLPVMMLVSSQVNFAVRRRYHSSNLLVLIGSLAGDPTTSTFAFYRDVVGYDLGGFFERHSEEFRKEVQGILGSLLSPD
ncbi:MAG: hypothetical protein HYX25_03335 [Candidatus Solibacter usitatus]|nr:hypothetical protein [Candidatus Solibacter usitatus]